MVGDLLGVLDGTAVFQVGGDAGGPEGVVADFLVSRSAMHKRWATCDDCEVRRHLSPALIVVSAALGLGSSVQCRRAVRLAASRTGSVLQRGLDFCV